MSQENVAAAKEAYKAFGQGDIAGAVAGMDENAEWVTSDELPLGGTLHGREEIAQAWASIPDYFDEFSVEPDEFIDAGDVVIVHGMQHARAKDTGVAFDCPYLQLLRMRDGKTIRGEFFADSAKALHALEGQPAH
jgi:ketosteroid isomerase-like protein